MQTADDIREKRFLIALRGYDRDEVEAYLDQLATQVATMQSELAAANAARDEAMARAASAGTAESAPVAADAPAGDQPLQVNLNDRVALLQTLGEETTRILTVAEQSAAEIREKAEREAAELRETADVETTELRQTTDAEVAELRATAEAEARELRETAKADARAAAEQANRQASRVISEAERRRDRMAAEIHAVDEQRLLLIENLQGAVDRVTSTVAELQQGSRDAGAEGQPDEEPAPAGAVADADEDLTHDAGEDPDATVDDAGDLTVEEYSSTDEVAEDDGAAGHVEDDADVAALGDAPVEDEGEDDIPADDAPDESPTEDVTEDEAPAVEDEPVADDEAPLEDDADDGAPTGEVAAAASAALVDVASDDVDGESAADVEELDEPAVDAEPEVEVEDLAPDEEEAPDSGIAELQGDMVRELRRGLQSVQSSVLEAIRTTKDADVDTLLPSDPTLDELGQLSESHFEDAYSVAVITATEQVDGQVPGELDDSARVPSATATFRAVLAHEVTSSLRPTLRAGLEAEESETSLSERVGEVFRDLKGPVLESLASQHLSRAYGHGLLDAWQALGVESLQWVVGSESRCPENRCAANADAGAVTIGEDFPSGDRVPPAHPGCTCTISPV